MLLENHGGGNGSFEAMRASFLFTTSRNDRIVPPSGSQL